MKDYSQTFKDSKPRLAADLDALVKDAEELLSRLANNAGEDYAEARDRLKQTLKSTREKLDGVQELALDNAAHARDAADAYVRRNPWESIGIGAAVGLVLGMLIARR
jgi:ElaB/YqjD/DUF883 family membrane-anchored ribosome-binding protein